MNIKKLQVIAERKGSVVVPAEELLQLVLKASYVATADLVTMPNDQRAKLFFYTVEILNKIIVPETLK